MSNTPILHVGIAAALVIGGIPVQRSVACCAVAPDSRSVVNADQTVIMVWDAEKKTQHFIRQASFKSDAADVGFLVPTPSRPQLEESGDAAFATLRKITTPMMQSKGMVVPLGCSAAAPRGKSSVVVVEEKRVAGFDATVLTAANGTDLANWLRDHGYSYSPQVAEWAHPYVAGGWMMVALKVAKPQDGRAQPNLAAAALRLSFKTERPLFPYREPESAVAAKKLGTSDRLLRIYFISDGQYRGTVGGDGAWSGRVVWSGDITRHRAGLLRDLKLPADTGPAQWWLTKFDDQWPYARAAGDVHFSRTANQQVTQRSPAPDGFQCDLALTGFLAMAALRPFRRRRRE
jgi:Uncharacterized protein conserved in bacteria (DUF2330)